MLTIRKADDRGHANHGWLDSHHTFSFAGYRDPAHMGFRSLRVINEDRVQPSQGFGTHGNESMEIISYVVDGAMEHKDSMGTGSVLQPGDVQRMSAGRGVTHSEFNHSPTEPLRFLQIWVLPESEGIDPSYEERHFAETEKRSRLRLIVSPDGEEGSLRIHQDVRVYASILAKSESVEHEMSSGRHAWVQVVQGSLSLNGDELHEGDGAAVSDLAQLSFEGVEEAEFLIFDLK